MRVLIGFLLSSCLLAAEPLEVSTGFLIGPKYDSHAFYFRDSPKESWQKTYSSNSFRRTVQGRLIGAAIPAEASRLEALAATGVRWVRVHLQGESTNYFAADGSLSADSRSKLKSFLESAASQGIAVELVLFHPEQDQNFDSPESMLNAATSLIDWLIDLNLRHVLLNPASEWSSPGWHFESYVPNNLAQIASAIRDRFQVRHTDYALPIVISARNRLLPDSAIVREADVIIARGEALGADLRRIDRPVLVQESNAAGCAQAFDHFSGCLIDTPADEATLRSLSQLILKSAKP